MNHFSQNDPAFMKEPWSAQRARAGRRISKGIVVGLLGVVDVSVFFLAWSVAYFGYYRTVFAQSNAVVPYMTLGGLGALAIAFLIKSLGWYEFAELKNLPLQFRRVGAAVTLVLVAMVTIGFLSKTDDAWSRGWILSWYSTGLLFLCANRVVFCRKLQGWEGQGLLRPRLAVIGDPDLIARTLDHFAAEQPDEELVGVFSDDPSRVGELRRDGGWPVGDDADLIELARTEPLDRIVIVMSWADEQRIARLMARLKFVPCDVRMAFDTQVLHYHFRGFSKLGGQPVLEVYERPLKDWQYVAKRIEDVLVASLALLICAPFMAMVVLAIRLDTPGPILFRQPRHGFNNSIFEILKFRTMHEELSDKTGVTQTRPGDPRVTRVGRFLRQWSLDELPQLWNVLRGDMSIVGPRPHPIQMRASGRVYEELVEDYASRHRVKPGLTGWAQVNGWRGPTLSEESARRRIEHDLHYIENWSLWFDAKIIGMTFFMLFSRKNAF